MALSKCATEVSSPLYSVGYTEKTAVCEKSSADFEPDGSLTVDLEATAMKQPSACYMPPIVFCYSIPHGKRLPSSAPRVLSAK